MSEDAEEKRWFMKSLTREEYEKLDPEEKILTVIDEEWAELSPEEQAERWKKAAEGADKHILLARARRARKESKDSSR